jgi:hypothetical protein
MNVKRWISSGVAALVATVLCLSMSAPASAGDGPGGPGNELRAGVGSVNLLGPNVDQTPQVAAATAVAACGNVSGYGLVGQYAIYDLGVRKGTLMICWSSSAGKNSALNYCYNNCGVRHVREVGIGVAGPTYWIDDSEIGNFYYYAGPVYTTGREAVGHCIKAYAQTDYGPINNYGPFHCG